MKQAVDQLAIEWRSILREVLLPTPILKLITTEGYIFALISEGESISEVSQLSMSESVNFEKAH